MTLEEQLKNLILSKYKSIREFSLSIKMPYSTIDSIFKRGIGNAGVGNIIRICRELNIDVDQLANGYIVEKSSNNRNNRMFDDRLKNLRRSKGLTQNNVAQILNIPLRTYVSYENNEREPNSELLVKLVNLFGVTADYLLGINSNFGYRNIDSDVEMFQGLDDNDKAEIRGEMRQMLKADKYKNKENNIIQITEQPRKEFDFSTAKIAGDDGEFRIIHYTPEQHEEIRKAIEKDPELKKFFGI